MVRLISQIARFFTLIKAHPDIRLGRGILIDHGCEVVIGEITVVGNSYIIYQGITLGGVGIKKGKHHPTLDNDVMVGTDAKTLSTSEVGDNCFIATNAVLLKPLEDNMTAVGIPAHPVKKDGATISKEKKSLTLEEYKTMKRRMEQTGKEIDFLKGALKEARSEEQSTQEKIHGK